MSIVELQTREATERPSFLKEQLSEQPSLGSAHTNVEARSLRYVRLAVAATLFSSRRLAADLRRVTFW
jgi:hypothetical protein